MPLRRPALHTETLVFLCALYLLAACNLPFWRAVVAGRSWTAPGTLSLLASLSCSFVGLYVAAGCALATRWTVRPLLSALVLVSAALSYYIDRYHVFFDRNMLRNVLATNVGEARELLGWQFAAHMLLLGALPAALLWWPRLTRRALGRAVLARAGWMAGGLLVAMLALLPVFADFASVMRNHRELRHLLTPGNAIAAAVGTAFAHGGRPDHLTPIGQDARPGPGWEARRRTLFVLVVGETARAQNFSLNGYGRDTNPELARRGVVNFPHATACGTSTEVSLPCMFSPYGRHDYDEGRILSHESLLHVLHHAGMQVLWRDNQSGCKGVCAGLPLQEMARTVSAERCPDGQCPDEVLLEGLDQAATDARGNVFVVLHQLGSHGPAYHRRYPPAFKRFVPACEQDELRRCSTSEIVNAYDNTLLYTDHVLGRLIDLLRQQQSYDTAMLYVSDHGESLGESGLYLHGVPYAIAPDVQKHVPMVAWLSPSFARSAGLDTDCLRGRADQPVSHDNLFHSILGVLDVETGVYDPARDLFRPCRRPPPA
ncbi:MAG TPA: phosphoethanolamine--lipid A transferase [Ramlibacter sp.]|jgi:lipid A ethanolaminephosphotransferase|uniref:phosphoethanolamine transferase n=1 Tax=Ramlibacter sp. TaxID=1917967 RepID=UPI002D5556D2|nr:phosphoethanolamine--lipid A transferase [Ramlibacter sp.]HZY19422.1 phosphoethanolamine--lipid A transferase [Ramlibacter sp.]